jgi:uncharacterized protein
MLELLRHPWPWYISGPLIGLTVPLLLFLGNKSFGISSSLRHLCAALLDKTLDKTQPNKIPFFNYDWRKTGSWNLVFAVGILLGGCLGGILLANPEPLQISAKTTADLAQLGVTVDGNFAPATLFNWAQLFTWQGFVMFVLGGFLIGFGTAYAGGCTSGHAIMGLADLQLPSLVAVIGFFIGGLISTHFILPLLF